MLRLHGRVSGWISVRHRHLQGWNTSLNRYHMGRHFEWIKEVGFINYIKVIAEIVHILQIRHSPPLMSPDFITASTIEGVLICGVDHNRLCGGHMRSVFEHSPPGFTGLPKIPSDHIWKNKPTCPATIGVAPLVPPKSEVYVVDPGPLVVRILS